MSTKALMLWTLVLVSSWSSGECLTPATRPANGAGAPSWIVVGGRPGSTELRAAAGMSAPVDQNGDFLIGPDYLPAPELSVVQGRPQGNVQQFTIESKGSHFYPGIARDAFG